MQDIYFLDKEFDRNNSKNYNLSIQACLNGFSFSIFNPQSGKHIGIKSTFWTNNLHEDFNIKLKNALLNEPLFKLSYKKTTLLYSSQQKTIIPKEYFQKEYISQLYAPCQNLENNEILIYNSIESLKSVIVFSIEESLFDFINQHLENPEIVHYNLPLLQYAMKTNNSLFSNVFINIMEDYFDIIIIENNKLKLSNSHTINSEIDIAYFILNTLKGLHITPDSCKCIISGIVNKESEAIKILKKYIKNTDYSNTYGDIKFLKKHNIDRAYYANLLNVETCV
jgi:hypothetical protein